MFFQSKLLLLNDALFLKFHEFIKNNTVLHRRHTQAIERGYGKLILLLHLQQIEPMMSENQRWIVLLV